AERAGLVGVKPVEVADVPVQRAGERDHCVRIEPARGQHRRKGVEVRVPVRGDDFFGAHGDSVPMRRAVVVLALLAAGCGSTKTVTVTKTVTKIRTQTVSASGATGPSAHFIPSVARGLRTDAVA